MSKYNDNKSDNFMEPTVSQHGGHMVMTNVHKPMKTKYVNLDTIFADEYNLNNTADYNITLPEKITNVQSVSISNIDLPMSFYNISSDLGNNVFRLTYGGNEYICEVPSNQYTEIDAFINAINTVINSTIQVNAIFSVSNNNFLISNTTTFPMKITFDVNTLGTDRYNFKSKLGWLLGFRKLSYNLEAPSSGQTTVIKAECNYNINTIRYMYLVIDEFSRGNQNTFISPLPSSLINKNIIAKLSLNSSYPFNSIIPLNRFTGLMSDQRCYSGKIDLQKLNIKLINEYGKTINLNGNHFSFCMEINYE
jgi:hypothetical protein